MPADRVIADAPAGAAERGVARRPVLIGLAVVAAAGLAGTGWELTRGSAPRHAASGVRRGRATSAPQASAPRSTPAPHVGTKLWSFATGGLLTAIALDSGTVFAGGDDGIVYALRASDGSELWSFATGGPVASQIAVAGRTAYVGSNDGKVYALTG